jgi:hypothetical protein
MIWTKIRETKMLTYILYRYTKDLLNNLVKLHGGDKK